MLDFFIRLPFALYGAYVGRKGGLLRMFLWSLFWAGIGEIFGIGLMEVIG